jgi:hypothetical protein
MRPYKCAAVNLVGTDDIRPYWLDRCRGADCIRPGAGNAPLQVAHNLCFERKRRGDEYSFA